MKIGAKILLGIMIIVIIFSFIFVKLKSPEWDRQNKCLEEIAFYFCESKNMSLYYSSNYFKCEVLREDYERLRENGREFKRYNFLDEELKGCGVKK